MLVPCPQRTSSGLFLVRCFVPPVSLNVFDLCCSPSFFSLSSPPSLFRVSTRATLELSGGAPSIRYSSSFIALCFHYFPFLPVCYPVTSTPRERLPYSPLRETRLSDPEADDGPRKNSTTFQITGSNDVDRAASLHRFDTLVHKLCVVRQTVQGRSEVRHARGNKAFLPKIAKEARRGEAYELRHRRPHTPAPILLLIPRAQMGRSATKPDDLIGPTSYFPKDGPHSAS